MRLRLPRPRTSEADDGTVAPGRRAQGGAPVDVAELQARVRVAEQEVVAARAVAERASTRAGVLLAGLTSAEEAVRAQLAAELHDGVAQSLARARSVLGGRAEDGVPLAGTELVELAETVRDVEEQVRAVTARLRPPQLRDGDLARAVSDLRADMAVRYGLAVQVDWPDEAVPLPLASAVVLFRFYQEALVNVAKHADVDEVRLSLAVRGGALVASVADDGPGFDPGAVRATQGRHIGLGLLRERARIAGGALDVRSSPGAGTVLTLTLRLPQPAPTGCVRAAGGPPAAGA